MINRDGFFCSPGRILRPCDKQSECMFLPTRTCYPAVQGSMYGLGDTYLQIACHRLAHPYSSRVQSLKIWSSQASSQVTGSKFWSSQASSQVMSTKIWSSQVSSQVTGSEFLVKSSLKSSHRLTNLGKSSQVSSQVGPEFGQVIKSSHQVKRLAHP